MTSKIKVDNINKVSDDSNIIKKCGSTITVGSCGATVALATGATQTGFGRTGTVNWCTTVKTSPFTATSGSGFFVNTTGGTVTVTLPSSPSAGDIVSIADYAGTAATACKQIAIGRGGSKFQGVCNCGVLNKARESVTLIYVDGTQGWVPIQDQEGSKESKEYITASGGTVTCSGDYKIHTFTSSGCFQVTAAGNAAGSNKVSYVVVAAGGGSGGDGGGGGGAGGFREGKCTSDPYTASPLDAGAGLTVPVATYPITIGAGGAGGAQPAPGNNGNPSVFSSITSTGGGLGGSHSTVGGNGGSGGGGSRGSPYAAGTGNTPPVSPAQGKNGGNGGPPNGGDGGGGGGGATVAGTVNATCCGGTGGAGATSVITGTPVARAGGGGGGATPVPSTKGAGGAGGGGNGSGCGTSGNATAGTVNTGGGAGGTSGGPGIPVTLGKAGGSGIVIIRYKFQN
jgi:hypothetical protein